MKESLSWNHLKDLKTQLNPSPQESVPLSLEKVYATGKRKTSVARVWLKVGKGQIIINGKTDEDYFGREAHRHTLLKPFHHTSRVGSYDVWCTVKGGGLSGQVGAIRHGISKALQIYEPLLRSPLKSAGFLTRDARKVERKKPGLRKARRAPQFSKR